MLKQGSIFIISAPSGAGKTSLLKALAKALPNIVISISYTTRAKRKEEEPGIDYHFVSHDEFKGMLKEDVFLEYAEVFGEFYGTSRVEIEKLRKKGVDIILEIDWQGARQIRQKFIEAQSIFILPPSREALLERLQKRHQDSPGVVAKRINEAKEEISRYNEYDYLICNDRFEEALEDLKAIVRCQRLAWRYQQMQQAGVLERLLS